MKSGSYFLSGAKRYLPHLTPPGGTFFVTSVLKDALPTRILNQLKKEKKQLIDQLRAREQEEENYKAELTKIYKRQFEKYDRLLNNAAQQAHYLKDPKLCKILADKFKQYDGKYYNLDAYCIMSNHFHLLIDTSIQLDRLPEGESPNEGNYVQLSKIMQLIKGGSAFEINK